MAGPFAPFGLSFPPLSESARMLNFNERDFQLQVLAGLSALNTATEAQNAALDSTPGQVTVNSTAGGVTLLAASSVGKKVSVYNFSATIPVIISDGGTPTSAAGTAVIQPGGYWERPVCSKSALKAITASSTANVGVTVWA